MQWLNFSLLFLKGRQSKAIKIWESWKSSGRLCSRFVAKPEIKVQSCDRSWLETWVTTTPDSEASASPKGGQPGASNKGEKFSGRPTEFRYSCPRRQGSKFEFTSNWIFFKVSTLTWCFRSANLKQKKLIRLPLTQLWVFFWGSRRSSRL